jgi:hypothetical protein
MVVIPARRSDRFDSPRAGGGGIMATKAKSSVRKPFGGFSISFKGASDSLEDVFGNTPIGPAEMTKKLWVYVKRKKLSAKR